VAAGEDVAGQAPVGREAPHSAWLELLSGVLTEVLRSDIAEFELSQPSLWLRVRRRIQAAGIGEDLLATPAEVAEAELVALSAPLTGVFYGAPAPGARRYAEPGEWVEVGSLVGLIEAMKVFNEVVADRSGALLRIVAMDGTLVHAGDPLMLLDPRAAPPSGPGPVRE
jgi:biotin carboxyl carrier protein